MRERTGRLAVVMMLLGGLAACGGPAVRTADGLSGTTRSPHDGSGVITVTARPDDLDGASPSRVRSLLGVPGLTRREPPAEVWQYVGRDCVIDVVFYPPDDDAGALRATHLDSRDLEGASLAPAACLRRLARRTN